MIYFLIAATALFENATTTSIIRGTDTYALTYSVTLPELSGPANLWIPIAHSNAFQSVSYKIQSKLKGTVTQDDKYKNRTLFFKLGPSNSLQKIVVTYRVTRLEKTRYPEPQLDRRLHLGPDKLVPNHEEFSSLANRLTKNIDPTQAKARALYNHVLKKMKYDKSGTGWGRGDAMHACRTGAGNCTDYHSFFMALARAVQIPVRFTIGFSIPADRHEGIIKGYHCWAEFYADGYWIPVDISEADKHPDLSSYYFGHHPANRLKVSDGRDIQLDPPPSSGLQNFLFYPLLEVRGKKVETRNQFGFRRALQAQP